jgi:hypothetical protein
MLKWRCSAREQISGGYGALRDETEINLKGKSVDAGLPDSGPSFQL